MDSHVKSFQTDGRSKNRIRFASSKQRSKRASADVYRNYKRRGGVNTASAGREEHVHNPSSQDSKRPNKRARKSQSGDNDERQAVVPKASATKEIEMLSSGSESDAGTSGSNLASELDVALDRNASEIFGKFHREIWGLARSLPEVLHHAPKIVDLMLSYMLSPETLPSETSPPVEDTGERRNYIVNLATTDILHLLAVLARDLRHEIHPFLHTKIVPRIVNDLLNPPPPPHSSGKQAVPLDVSIVELAFRTLSYIFRYDAEMLLKEVDKTGQEPCLDPMRKYYGVTLAHRRELIRRLAAETFAPLIRKLPTDAAKKRHLRRVVRALAASSKQAPTSPSAERMQADAVDGISRLCFEVTRGIAGRMHSKGNMVIKCVMDCVGKSDFSEHGQSVVYSVASAFLGHLSLHLRYVQGAPVLYDLIGILKRLVASSEKGEGKKKLVDEASTSSERALPLIFTLQLVNQMVSHRNGVLLLQDRDQSLSELSDLFELLFDTDRFGKLSSKTQATTVTLLCSAWKVFPENSRFGSRMSKLIRGVLETTSVAVESDGGDTETIRAPAFILVEDLFPYLPIETAMSSVGQPILSTAARVADEHPALALTLVHAVSSRQTKALTLEVDPNDIDGDDDAVFFLSNAGCCQLSAQDRERLLKVCLLDVQALELNENELSRLLVAAKCAPFLCLVPSERAEGKAFSLLYNKVSKWMLRLLETIESGEAIESDVPPINAGVVFSVALEGFALLSLECYDKVKDESTVKKALTKAKPVAVKYLLANPTSMWAVKSVASFVEALQQADMVLNDDADVVFDALVQNLRESYHFRRLHSLRILSHYPPLPFVTDHADLDLTGDLDEEQEPRLDVGNGSKAKTAAPAGPCTIMKTLLEIESSPISLTNERPLISLVSRVEIFARTARLPVVYAEAAASHMLGILNVKFSLVWPAAVRSLIALSKSHEDCVWPPVQDKVAELMQARGDAPEAMVGPDIDTRGAFDPIRYHNTCVAWETSNGKDTTLFRGAVMTAKEQGRVSRHDCTDEATVLESVWDVVGGAPQLLTRHSRVMVPIFLQFMVDQYYVVHPNDPDARELRVQDQVELDNEGSDPISGLSRKVVQRRLTSVLRAFSSVNGPHQLFKHQLLLSIFTSLVGYPEAVIAQLAFSCVLQYKPEYLVPYADPLKKFFGKGQLRDAMLQFHTLMESGTIISEHRSSLIPMMSRILFGRLSARTSGGAKSSKDSPAARRMAVLSFLASLCESDDDLYPFIYLIVRTYLPLKIEMKAVELHELSDRKALHETITSVGSSDCGRLPLQVHQGVLNMFEAVVSQLGHRVLPFVPSLMSVVLALCQFYGVKAGAPTQTHEEVPEDDDESDGRDVDASRRGSVRTLCYRRLSDIYSQFAGTFDFGPYTARLWEAVGSSLALLPEMVLKADKPPALLLLLQTLSTTPKLVQILEQKDEAVKAVLMCISSTSRTAVINSTLAFVNNLLAIDGSSSARTASSSPGSDLIQRHVGLLLNQLKDRLDSASSMATSRPTKSRNNKKDPSASSSWRRELDILCRVSSLVDNDPTIDVAVLDSLCSMLIPFLELGKCSDTDRFNILGVLDAMLPKLSAESLVSYHSKLSTFLGPWKAKPGILSKQVRRSFASIFKKIAIAGFPASRRAADVLVGLSAVHTKRVDEIDYDAVVPALSGLSESDNENNWLGLSMHEDQSDPSVLLPLIYTMFQFLFDEDGLISRGSFRALKDLVVVAAGQIGLGQDGSQETVLDETQEKWKRILEGCFVPLTRSGLGTRDASVRRYYILILSDVARWTKHSASPHLYGDLSSLIRDDDPDLDFFLSITHVQLHRRVRALRRLRALLNGSTDDDDDDNADTTKASFSTHSLSNVLLPLALHPVYESQTKLEEHFALEAIATVGAISRLLPWSKYNSILWTTLSQFERHPSQERYLIGLICAIIDGFHFGVINENEDDATKSGSNNNAVWRALENRIVPKVESLLVKEKSDRSGTKVKILRPSVIMALLKLFKKLPQDVFISRLPRLLAVICDGLKNKDSDARDMARKTLASITVELDIVFLADIVRELAITLTDGYQLHVRSAAIHSMLLELSEVYKPPIASDGQAGGAPLPFDKAVPALMDLVQQDLFGLAQERKEAENNVRYVKEASGSKSSHSIELIASMILFNPSATGKNVSAIHAIVSPLLERLRSPGTPVKTIRRIKECLTRVVAGLSRNPSVKTDNILPFIYATVEPFVSKQEVNSVMDDIPLDDEDSDDEEDLTSINVSGGAKAASEGDTQERAAGSVTEWRPSTLKSSTSNKEAHLARKKEERAIKIARDGASAPKLTGSRRYDSPKISVRAGVNDPANVSAVVFGLHLLHSSLRKMGQDKSDHMIAMLDPFIPLLTTCTCLCRDSDVVLLALRCLGSLLRTELPSFKHCSKSLASKTLEVLASSGAVTNINQDLLHASFKMLTFLINFDVKNQDNEAKAVGPGENVLEKGNIMPLDGEQMQVLISFLRGSLTESDHHNPAVGLIKALVHRRFMSPEFYDLIETILNQNVRSPRLSLRHQSETIFVIYLLNYPMSEGRLEQHLKQVILNIKYEYAEGRLSAISLLSSIIQKLPQPVLEQQCQLFFLPLTLQLANDDAQECREAIAKCLGKLLQRLDTDMLQSLYDYTERWSQQEGALRRTSIQLYGIFLESSVDFLKRGDTASSLLARLEQILKDAADDKEEWEVTYFALVCLEKVALAFADLLEQTNTIWPLIIKSLIKDHPWIRLASSRIVNAYLSDTDIDAVCDKGSQSFLVRNSGALFEIARNLCYQLNSDEQEQDDDLTALATKSLPWILQAATQHPSLCYTDKDKASEKKRDPVMWILTRMSNMVRSRGTRRRQAVYTCFAAFGSVCPAVITPHLELLLEPLHRSEVETRNELEIPALLMKQDRLDNDAVTQESLLAKDVLHLLEEHCQEQDYFLQSYAAVKKRARDKKDRRVNEKKTQAIVDPEGAANRRIHKQEGEKKRRKKRKDERRVVRGGVAKRRHLED